MLADALATALIRSDNDVEIARDAKSAQLFLVDHNFELILLDLGLPEGSGMGVLGVIRRRYDTTPVIIMTARDRLSDRIEGLDAGADDYLVKPFHVDELQARLRAVMRRTQGRISPVLTCGDLVVDPAHQTVTLKDKPVDLSSTEYKTLLALMERPGKSLSRNALELAVYGDSGVIGSNTLAVYIHQLRRKLGEGMIETVHGYGYRIKAFKE